MITPEQNETTALQGLTVHPFSDLLIHHMGKGLADDITQGAATGDMFRSTPLWGVGQRRFFLHDGRADDLMKAVEAPHSRGQECGGSRTPLYRPAAGKTTGERLPGVSAKGHEAALRLLRAPE